MKAAQLFQYPACSTCKKAVRFLDQNGISYKKVSIVENPPSADELRSMLSFVEGDVKKLFNTSGVIYREMGLSEKLKTLPEAEAIELLSKNGKLVKRPFLLGTEFGLVGFREDEWKAALSL
jgi:Spx/MgsR family transcriptional regulator